MTTDSYRRIPHIDSEIEELVTLSMDLRWSWSHKSDAFWEKLHPELWYRTRNPFLVLQTISTAKLKEVADDPVLRSLARLLIDDYKRQRSRRGWFREHYDNSDLNAAYFSMEYGLSDALRIYSGGLGILAGDHLKTCNDLGVPLVGIGLLFQRGYFRQSLDAKGNQLEFYPYNDPSQLPITALRNQEGEWLKVSVDLPGRTVTLKTWEVRVGNIRLFLLDSNDPMNTPADCGITSELYGGGPEVRIQQEIVLGIGGWRLLEKLGITPNVCHLNEGHAAFVVFDRARSYMKANNTDLDTALCACRPGNIFTTHTPVEAGFDRFNPDLVRRYLEPFSHELGISMDKILSYGRSNPDNDSEEFNMAYLAIRGSGAVNGVSELHGKVSREIFAPLFPGWKADDVPVTHVTNGIHVPSWDSVKADELWSDTCGEDVWFGEFEGLSENILQLDDETLWKWRNQLRHRLVSYIRHRGKLQLASTGFLSEHFEDEVNVLDENVLTIGFARRFATYKRPNLLLYDTERFLRILNNNDRPVQLIIAGKAHPADQAGKDMIRQWCEFISQHNVHNRVIYLADYDMVLGEHLVHGVDLWLNNPRLPMEASGTSGMKVLVNGGLNLSARDGWWAEGYNENVGWAIETASLNPDEAAQDLDESKVLYDILEQKIIPDFYERDEEGLPTRWIEKMRVSMATLTPQFSTNRMVRDYVKQLYLPAAERYKQRNLGGPDRPQAIEKWRQNLEVHWQELKLGEAKLTKNDEGHVLHLPVFHGELDPQHISIDLIIAGDVTREMEIGTNLAWQDRTREFTVVLDAEEIEADLEVRITAKNVALEIPLETNQLLRSKITLAK